MARAGSPAVPSPTRPSCAKGVLHRHFADFDAFLAELVLDRATRLAAQADVLRDAAGSGSVVDNLAKALTALFGPVPVAIIPLITFRDELRARLRAARPGGGMAILGEMTQAVSAYLAEERALGRIAADADIDSLTLSLVGGGHLVFADRDSGAPGDAAIGHLVATVLMRRRGVAPSVIVGRSGEADPRRRGSRAIRCHLYAAV